MLKAESNPDILKYSSSSGSIHRIGHINALQAASLSSLTSINRGL